MEVLQEIVTAAREYRADSGTPANQMLDVVVAVPEEDLRKTLDRSRAVIERLGRLQLNLTSEANPAIQHLRVIQGVDIGVRVPAMAEAQRQRLMKEIEQLEKNIANSRRQLSDETFLSRAPGHVIEGIRKKLIEYEEQLSRNRRALAA
jgi:valyl-tRNA synthetase